MAKRRLSRRQAWRIQKIQQERIERANSKSRQAERQLTSDELGVEQTGLVIAHFGTQVAVEALEGELAGQVQRAHFRANLDALVTGDKVVWRPAHQAPDPSAEPRTDQTATAPAGTGVVVARIPRTTELCRPDPHGTLKPIAANIDQIIITCAPEPPVYAALLDRYLIAAEHQQVAPILLLNKQDLLNDDNRAATTAMLDNFAAIGYPIVYTSTQRAGGLRPLEHLLTGKTSVFVGQSGVGKSSLINAILPMADTRVGALSASTGKGRHTTTTARLFHLPCGGQLIDSPGIRDFGLWHMGAADIAQGFRDFRPFLGHCRFRDCSHGPDPGCALVAAVAAGQLQPRRLHSYHLLIQALGANG